MSIEQCASAAAQTLRSATLSKEPHKPYDFHFLRSWSILQRLSVFHRSVSDTAYLLNDCAQIRELAQWDRLNYKSVSYVFGQIQ
jgi:hypothetical protein